MGRAEKRYRLKSDHAVEFVGHREFSGSIRDQGTVYVGQTGVDQIRVPAWLFEKEWEPVPEVSLEEALERAAGAATAANSSEHCRALMRQAAERIRILQEEAVVIRSASGQLRKALAERCVEVADLKRQLSEAINEAHRLSADAPVPEIKRFDCLKLFDALGLYRKCDGWFVAIDPVDACVRQELRSAVVEYVAGKMLDPEVRAKVVAAGVPS